MRVPDAVRLKLGMCEVHRSLKTYNQAKARLLAAFVVPRVQEVFRMAMIPTLDRLQLTALLQSHFEELAAEVDRGHLSTSDHPELEVMEQRGLSYERIADLKEQIEINVYDSSVRHAAARLIEADPASIMTQSAPFVADMCQGVARAEVEQLKLLLHRLTDRLTPYVPADPLFVGPSTRGLLQPQRGHERPAGPSLASVVEHHLEAGKSHWRPKTYESKRVKLGYLVEHIGVETPITSITPDTIRSYKTAIGRLRSNHHAGKAHSFAEKQTENEKLRIAPETVLNIYNPARAFFSWATNVEG
jgi:hypothetical protein